jgi:RNA polymerase sporulation-specific sigma factor
MARNNNQVAAEILFNKYELMIISAAKRYYLSGFDFDDLCQEARVEFWKAIKSFDPSKSPNFTNYAKLCIGRRMIDLVRNTNREKQIPLNNYKSIYNLDNAKELFVTYIDPEFIVLENERKLIISRILKGEKGYLTELERLAIIYKYLYGFDGYDSYPKIASFLSNRLKREIKPKVVDNALFRAMRRLRKLFLNII